MKCNVFNIKTTKQAWLYFCRHCHESSDCFKYPKKSLLKSPLKTSHTKKILGKFSYPKKYQNQKIQTQIKSFDHPHHLNSRVPLPPTSIQSRCSILYRWEGFKAAFASEKSSKTHNIFPPSLREYKISNGLQYPKGIIIICCLR